LVVLLGVDLAMEMLGVVLGDIEQRRATKYLELYQL
jgi:hypothetical protein